MRLFCALLACTVLMSAPIFADTSVVKARSVVQLAEGVYAIRHPDAPGGVSQSNTTVIIGRISVLVVDSCLLPSAAKEDIDQIRSWTTLPVTYLLNTHFHNDHTTGNAVYAAAFPEIQIVAQSSTQRDIATFNPGALARYPEQRKMLQKTLDTGIDPDGNKLTDSGRRAYVDALAGFDRVLAEMKDTVQVVPNVTFDRELTINLGDREAQLRFIGRGHTAGDTVVYLPKEKILVAGDLVVHPVPYFFGGFPADDVQTLQTLAQFDAATIVPGHGEMLHDFSYVRQLMGLLNTANQAVMKALNNGATTEADAVEAARKDINYEQFATEFTGNNAEDRDFFSQTFISLLKWSFNQQRMR